MLEGDENETFKFCLILARKMIGRRWFGVKFKKKKKMKTSMVQFQLRQASQRAQLGIKAAVELAKE